MVEGAGLENRKAREGLVGSNPTPSAKPVARFGDSLANGSGVRPHSRLQAGGDAVAGRFRR